MRRTAIGVHSSPSNFREARDQRLSLGIDRASVELLTLRRQAAGVRELGP